MFVGIHTLLTDRSPLPGVLAAELEDRGFESLWVGEHTHVPVSRQTPYPPGGDLPEAYRRTLDPFIALTAAASATRTLRVGTGVCLVAQHDPIVLAKQVASLDMLSGGRVVFGIGSGWNREEMQDHGIDPASRWAHVRDCMLAMERLWCDEEAEWQGRHVRFERSWMWPKPLQQPRPPVLVGGAASPRLFQRIAEYGDGWIPWGGKGLEADRTALQQAFQAAGRNPSDVRITVLVGSADAGKLEHYAGLGVERVLLPLPGDVPARDVETCLDGYAHLLAGLGSGTQISTAC